MVLRLVTGEGVLIPTAVLVEFSVRAADGR